MMKNKKHKFNYYRLILQWTVLTLLGYMVVRLWTDIAYEPDFETYCPFSGMLAFSSLLANNSLVCSMTSMQIVMGFTLILGIIIFSKLFCGYICPVGTVTEWLGDIGRKFKMQFTPKGIADKSLRIFKYALLFLTFYFTIESSELFCKKFDPYYAAFTGFSGDVDIIFAVIALVITIIGSVFIRQAWCKYFCPLGAVSNLFTYFPVFAVIFGIYWIVLLAGTSVRWIIPMTAVIAIAFLIEVIRLKDGIIIPLFRIYRNDDTCTNCKHCDRACPQGINVSNGPVKINHIDCNMCGDCITVCPQKDTLMINRKNLKWLPATLIVVLVAGGIFLGKNTELPTVNEQWGSEEQMKHAEIFIKSGLKDIKCYGSSMAFVSQMREVKGIIGVKTYVNSYTVKVYYDPDSINEKAVTEAIFSPVKYMVQTPGSEIAQMNCTMFGIGNFFDKYDAFYLTTLLEQQKGIYGFETRYGEPVIATVYYDNNVLNIEKIKATIECKEVIFESYGNKNTAAVNFKVLSIDRNTKTITGNTFLQQMFKPFHETFNRYEKRDTSTLSIYEIPMDQAAYPQFNQWLPYLESHLSDDTGVVALETKLSDGCPVARIYFINNYTDSINIFISLSNDSLMVKYKNGDYDKIENPFKFSRKGKVIHKD
ncbi:MAG: 4Fe-4S binding protein [Bacteroidia bacterium]|nr:4Fe-4S binding protein [Bacteroidia bacterium]